MSSQKTEQPKTEVLDRESERDYKVGLLVSLVPLSLPRDTSQAKKLAVKRYMRTFFRAMTDFELDFEFKSVKDNKSLSSDALLKVSQASQGYDRYIRGEGRKRGKE
jgi:hypothetical protein